MIYDVFYMETFSLEFSLMKRKRKGEKNKRDSNGTTRQAYYRLWPQFGRE